MPEFKDILFLVGAGASKDADLPMAIELTEWLVKDIEAQRPKLLPLVRFVHGGICFGRGCQGKNPSDKVNIEEFLIACHDLSRRDTSTVYPFVSAWHERLAVIGKLPVDYSVDGKTDAFEYLLNYSKERLREWLTLKNPSKAKYFWSLLEFLKKPYRLHIFTLNYDDLIERALESIAGEINQRWSTGFGPSGWEPKLFDDPKLEAMVYKLHGSFDWVDDEDLGICSVNWPKADRSGEIPSTYDPLLIFGTALKLTPTDPYLTLLGRFQFALGICDAIVVLGYGFGDDHINRMVLEALKRRPDLSCILANYWSTTDQLPNDFKEKIANERFINLHKKVGEALESSLILKEIEALEKSTDRPPPF
jgi:SIR2-like domain